MHLETKNAADESLEREESISPLSTNAQCLTRIYSRYLSMVDYVVSVHAIQLNLVPFDKADEEPSMCCVVDDAISKFCVNELTKWKL